MFNRGSFLVSRLANYYHDDARFLAFAFFAVSYQPDFDIKATNAKSKQLLGYEILGYWFFLAQDEHASQIIQAHVSQRFDYLCVFGD